LINYIWPIALVVFSNVLYQICAKSVPNTLNPFASLAVTYGVGTVVSLILFSVLNRGANLFKEISKVNWAPLAFGVVLVGLEIGWIYAYRAGWQVSTAQIVQSAFLAVVLIMVGALLYKETISWNKMVGVAICLVGLVFINYK
jgi:drug/metabolite transporter (DMT)-like permease